MGVVDYPIIDLIRKVRYWASVLPELVTESLMSYAGDPAMCCECRECLGSPGFSFRCHGCSRLLCRKCMLGAASKADRAERMPILCNFCSQSDKVSPFRSPKSLFSRSSTDKLSQLAEPRQLSSPRLLRCSAYRNCDDDQGDDEGHQFFTPLSVFSQDSSDIDSMGISAGHELFSFRSANSSPLDSPMPVEQRSASPLLGKVGFFDQDSPDQSNKYGSCSEDLQEVASDCTSENLVGYNDEDSHKSAPHIDFENDCIFYPPPPEDEHDDLEANFIGCADEDDDIGESTKLFKSSVFNSDAVPNNEKPNDCDKDALKNAVHEHFRALVSQLLKGEGVSAESEMEGMDWLEIISSLAWQAANFVKPDTSHGGSMDPGDYVKVKCVASGFPSDSTLVKGVVCTKNVKHKRMVSQHQNPRLLILGGALEYQKVPNELASIGAVLEQETNYMKAALSKIEALRPNVLLVEKSVSTYAQEYLLGRKEISLVLNVKKSLLERISRCTGAQIVSSIDSIAPARLGHCEMFRVEKVYDKLSSSKHSKMKSSKNLMFFEGCPRRLGCTVLLRGAYLEELKKLKHVLQFACFAAYHLSLETSFLEDEGASLPKLPVKHAVTLPAKLVEGDDFVMAATDEQHAGNNHMKGRPWNKPDIESCSFYPDAMHLNKEINEHSAEQQAHHTLFERNKVPEMDEFSYPENTDFAFESSSDVCLRGSRGLNIKLPCKAPTCLPPLSIDVRNHQSTPLEHSVKESSDLYSYGFLRSNDEHKKLEIGFSNEVHGDYFTTADNHQSILVSLSSTCIKKSRVCKRSQLFRIKFYGSFDKPLGRYLHDDLFDETYCCHSCKEPTEAHVRCYTHQQGSLTIVVRRLDAVKLPGARDGRIWMWHRCLKCERDKDGVPPATRRGIMSHAAWGLSFGKFLELSFSSHATANRIASCGHSLQRDCLRFYGFGNMVAFFHYSPVDILSVCLPPSVLDFTCHVLQEWLREEAVMVSNKLNILHGKISDVLHAIERKITSSEDELLKASIHRYVIKLKELLEIERHDYDVLLQPVTVGNIQTFKVMVDILELNRLRRALILDSYMWDRRLYSLDSLSKERNCATIGSQLTYFLSKSDVRECREEIPRKDRLFENLLGEVTRKSSYPAVTEGSFPKLHEEHSLQVLEGNTYNMVEMDLSIEFEGYAGSLGSSFIYSQYEDCDDTSLFADTASTFLENSASTTSSLSDKIDLAWSGSGQLVVDQPKRASEANTDGLFVDNPCYRRVKSPLRVYSFDSALKFRKRVHGGFLPVSLHLPSAKSFDYSGDLARLRKDPHASMRRAFSHSSPTVVPRLNNLLNHTPVHISAVMEKMTEGARLLLPQSTLDDIVIAVYDDEPSSIISYAMTSQEYGDYITSCLDEIEDFNMMRKSNSVTNSGSNYTAGTSLVSHHSDVGPDDPQLSRTHLLDPKEPHFRISFDDDYSIPSDKAKFSITCYFAKQFHALRKICCPSELDYIRSLSRCKRWSAQGGKSNVYFAKSLDERFIIKQVTKTELDSFEDFAPQYFKYLTQSITSGSPTCLAKVLGIYQVSVKHSKGGREMKIDIMVMENLFFKRNVARVYDLKGSVRSRYNPDTKGNNTVLLDLNLLETKPIFLGSKAKRRLERAVWNDTSFLASVDVMDYSLLVGIDETQKELVIGIIDYMRQYTWDKQLETWVKASGILGGPRNAAPTVISPLQYKKRFRKAMSNYFLTVPDQWSS